MTTALDLDLATLVGELEELACEHQGHTAGLSKGSHNDEPASHYAQARCTNCGRIGNVVAVCPAYATFVLSGGPSQCPGCLDIHPAYENVRILGPVNGRAS